MIKKFFKHLLTILIVGLGIINFSSAADYIQNVGYNYYSPWSMNINGIGGIDYHISNNGTFNISVNGEDYNNFLFFSNGSSSNQVNYLIIGRKNGKLYGFMKSVYDGIEEQGYFNKFAIVQTGYNFSHNNLDKYSLNLSFNDIETYLNSNNIIGFHGSNGNDYPNVNRAAGNFMRFPSNYISDRCLITDNETNPYLCFFHSTFRSIYDNFDLNLTDSLEYNVSNWSSPSSRSTFFDNSPISGGGNGGDGGNEGENQQGNRTNNNIYCPTIGQVMQNYGTNYNTGLCYNSTLNFNGTNFETVEKQDIFTVFTDYTTYTNRISIYRNNCSTANTQTNCNNAFSGEFKKYSIIANAINSNVDEKKLRNYCNMGLNYDPNWSTCVASGYIAEQPTTNEIMEEITNGNIENITTIQTPSSGNILNELINGDIAQGTGAIVGSGTREDIASRDIFGQLNQLKDKISGLFESRSGTNGIIPDYILWLIMTTLLLTVLLKK